MAGMNEAIFSSLKSQIDDLAEGRISSEELTRAYIERIKEHDGRFNIVIRRHFRKALSRARELDRYLSSTGETAGPLHGVPFTLKDAFRVAGASTSFGVPGVRWMPAVTNCTLVDRLLKAGAILIGQTNIPLASFDWQSRSPIYGLTRNPLDPKRTPGGSSGGSAASVAAHFAPFDVGTDIAGSIRYPAHCCGVFGLRTTRDFVPLFDFGPELQKEPFKHFVVAGPLARTIEDLQTVLAVLTETADSGVKKSKLKIAYTLGWNGIRAGTPSREAIEAFLKKAAGAGHEVTEYVPKVDLEAALSVWGRIVGFELKHKLPILVRYRPLTNVMNYFFNTRVFRGGNLRRYLKWGFLSELSEYEKAVEEASVLQRAFASEFKPFDLWVTPVSVGPAIAHQDPGVPIESGEGVLPYMDYLGHFVVPTSVFHHPVLSAPVGVGEAGLPVSVQLHGRPGGDWQLLADASRLNEFYLKPERRF